MSLRNQPYLPLYVQDFMTDEKLIECSASATGIYIRLLCIMHKSEEYGTISLRLKDKQSDDLIANFAIKVSKLMPYPIEEIKNGLNELIAEGVLQLEGDKLLQKRMLKDAELSEKRSQSISKRWKKEFYNTKSIQNKKNCNTNCNTKVDTNTENEIEYDNDISNLNNIEDLKNKEKEKIKKEKESSENSGDKYFLGRFRQMLPPEFESVWIDYIEFQTSAGITINQHNVQSHLRAFKDCYLNGIAPPELLEAFYQSNHKGLFFVSKNLIKEKQNGNGKSNSATPEELASIVARRFARQKAEQPT